MKKFGLLTLILGISVILTIGFFTGCEKLKIDNLSANSHLKKANTHYTKEQYKSAIAEYKKALELNPNLKVAYAYLGTSCSLAYKASLLPPGGNDDYANKKLENDEIRVKINENQVYIDEFIQNNVEFSTKLKENGEFLKKIKEIDAEIKLIPKYEEYYDQIKRNEELESRIKVREEHIKRQKEDLEASTGDNKDAKEESGLDELKKIDLTAELENMAEEIQKDKQEIDKNKVSIAKFEQQEKFQELNNVKKGYQEKIAVNEEHFNTLDGYEDYNKKVLENQRYSRQIGSNEAFIKKVEDNEEYRKMAVEYLLKAKEAEPENDNIILALSEIYDKMDNVDEAEKYYLLMLEKAPDNPRAYYTLASFYSKHGKFVKAQDMYEKRVALNPDNPEGYLFYIDFLQGIRKWDKAIETHEKRIGLILDPTILSLYEEIDDLNQKVKRIKSINQYVENVRKNKNIPKDQKEQLLAEKQEQLKEIGDETEIKEQLETKKKTLTDTIQLSDEALNGLSEEKQKILADAYYRLGNVLWNKSYQTPVDVDIMTPQERIQVVDRGFWALGVATKLAPDFPDPWAYMKLLYLEKAKAEPLKRGEYNQKGDEMGAKFLELRNKLLAKEAYLKQLEEEGQ